MKYKPSDICVPLSIVEPPTNVTLHCHNLDNIVEWTYSHLVPGIKFRVDIRTLFRSDINTVLVGLCFYTHYLLNILLPVYNCQISKISTLNWKNIPHAVRYLYVTQSICPQLCSCIKNIYSTALR